LNSSATQVLNCVIAQALFDRFPEIPEGDLSRIRASLVNRDTLARLARDLDLGSALRFGEGEQKSGGAGRSSILADALEAIFGAVFVDGGIRCGTPCDRRGLRRDLNSLDPATLGKDPKTPAAGMAAGTADCSAGICRGRHSRRGACPVVRG
jgi:ribonuclease-3